MSQEHKLQFLLHLYRSNLLVIGVPLNHLKQVVNTSTVSDLIILSIGCVII